MSIIGLGIDIIENIRITKIYNKFSHRLPKRILSKIEFDQYQNCKHPVKFLTKCFVIKEAAVKALGTGINNGITFNQFEITNNEVGKPLLKLFNKAHNIAQLLGVRYIHITLTHERLYTCSVVILEN
uniref:Holo-[acyl-carrier-protein] synthase n=1 Tax=Candidatus Aschnera chinzeii TaxID=1485666 RepID=A0AAT9G3U7_9ENTR|nr:MAG: holo-ACP synthase [Candidatus Aschnera chinzeii]